MAEDSENRGALAWIKGLALPIASLIASAAFFAIQMQQQAFERKLANIESGYRFYFDQRTRLQNSDDVNTEKALLQMIGSAFPNVYCYVRSDLYGRATAAENTRNTEANALGFGEDDRALLVSFIVANPAPARAEYPTEFLDLVGWGREPAPKPCSAAFDAADPAAPPPAPAEAPAAAEDSPLVAEATPAPSPAAGAAPAPSASTPAPPPAGAVTDVVESAVERVRIPQRTISLRSETYQVFFHIVEGGARDSTVADPFRAQLAQANFRVMRGVETVPAARFARQPVVRYFGPEQEAAANELAAFLNQAYASEGLSFHTSAIGDRYPTMPRTHLEVWVPDAR